MSRRQPRKLVVYELNEVPFKVIDYFMELHPGHEVSRAVRTSAQFVAYTPDQGHLHPTTTWPTFHRGVPDTVHGITEFGFDASEVNKTYPQVWDILARNGVTVGIGGSLGSYPVPSDLANVRYYLPDTFAPASHAYPEALSTFQDFNLSMVQQSGRNVQRGITVGKAMQVLRSARALGITSRTAIKIATQLVQERLNSTRLVRRRTLQAVLAFDVVYRRIASTMPQYATFFTNHVASAQHRYWAAAFPDECDQAKWDAEWRSRYSGEIEHAMLEAADQLSTLVRFTQAHPEYLLVILSSMGQAANDATKIERQLMLSDPAKLFSHLGIPAEDWERQPGMEPVYIFMVAERSRERFRTALNSMTVNGSPVSGKELQPGRFEVVLGHPNLDSASLAFAVGDRRMSPAAIGVENVEIQDAAASTGWHVPDGILVVYDPTADLSRVGSRERIETTAVTAGIIDSFGVDVPAYMPEPSPALMAALTGSRAARAVPRRRRAQDIRRSA